MSGCALSTASVPSPRADGAGPEGGHGWAPRIYRTCATACGRGMPTKQVADVFAVSPARTVETLWASMQSVLDQLTPSDAANCFRHCGYTLHDD